MGILRRVLLLGLIPLVSASAPADAAPRPTSGFVDPDIPARYERSRAFDLEHTALDLRFDFTDRSIEGFVAHTIRPYRDGVREIALDQHGMAFQKVVSDAGDELAFRVVGDSLWVELPDGVSRGDAFTFRVFYRTERPSQGFHWNIPDAHYPDLPLQAWSQGQSEENHFWFPTVDRPNERMTTEAHYTVRSDLVALGNGDFLGAVQNAGGTTTYSYRLDFPHAPYLVSVVLGEFHVLEQEAAGVPMLSYVPRDKSAWAERSFARMPDLMRIFTERFGPYPYSVYRQSCIANYLYGGMENITNVTLNEGMLHDAAAAGGYTPEGLLAHELGHQWWGVMVTTRNWADIWINEGLANYAEIIYWEDMYGSDTSDWYRLNELGSYLRGDQGYRRPLSTRYYAQPDDVFDSVAYAKGCLVTHMLRERVGDEAFFAALRAYGEAHRGQPAGAEDLQKAMEAESGLALDQFFDQWVYHGGHPELTVAWDWDADTRLLRVEVRQTQTVDELTPHFAFVTEVSARVNGKAHRFPVTVDGAEQEYFFRLESRPEFVEFDPQDTVIKDLTLRQSRSAWMAQLDQAERLTGKVRAARALAEESGEAVEQALLRVLADTTAFWGLRGEAAMALGALGTDSAVAGLLGQVAVPQVRVRAKVAEALGRAGLPEALSALRQLAAKDPSPHVAEAAVDAAVELDLPESVAICRNALSRQDAWGERVPAAGVSGLAKLEATGALNELERWAKPGAPMEVRGRAMRAAASLAHDLPEGDAAKKRVRRLLESQLKDPVLQMRRAAASSLGTLGDASARPALERAAAREDYPSVTQAAEGALQAIARNQGKDAAPDELRQQLEELQRDQRDLKRDLERLRKQVEAAGADSTRVQ